MPAVRWILYYNIIVTVALLWITLHYMGKEFVPPQHPIPQERWHHHILLPEQIADICSAFITKKINTGIPIACAFKNYATNECHIFLAPGNPGAMFALVYEEKRCAGFDIPNNEKEK